MNQSTPEHQAVLACQRRAHNNTRRSCRSFHSSQKAETASDTSQFYIKTAKDSPDSYLNRPVKQLHKTPSRQEGKKQILLAKKPFSASRKQLPFIGLIKGQKLLSRNHTMEYCPDRKHSDRINTETIRFFFTGLGLLRELQQIIANWTFWQFPPGRLSVIIKYPQE